MTTLSKTAPAGRFVHPILSWGAIALAGAGALAGMIYAPPDDMPLLAAGLGAAAVAMAARSPREILPYLLRDALALGLLAFMARGGLEAWQAPSRWLDVVHLTRVGGTFAAGLYL